MTVPGVSVSLPRGSVTLPGVSVDGHFCRIKHKFKAVTGASVVHSLTFSERWPQGGDGSHFIQ